MVLGDGKGVQTCESTSAAEIPLSKIPGPFEREGLFRDAQLTCNDRSECWRIVAAHAIEIDSEDKWLH